MDDSSMLAYQNAVDERGGLEGQLAGNASVETLQRALTAYAQVTGNVAYNPKGIDGIVGVNTLAAVRAVIGPLASKIGVVGVALQGALAMAMTSDIARQHAVTFIQSNATALARGVSALSIDAGAAAGSVSTAVVGKSSYPAGTIKTRHGAKWRVGIPIGTAITLQGASSGLGVTHEEVASQPATTDVAASEVDADAFEKAVGKPWYKKWQVWAGVGVGVVVVGTGIYFVAKR